MKHLEHPSDLRARAWRFFAIAIVASLLCLPALADSTPAATNSDAPPPAAASAAAPTTAAIDAPATNNAPADAPASTQPIVPPEQPSAGFNIPDDLATTQPSADPQAQLTLARQQRTDKNPELASRTLVALLQTNAPMEIKRSALLELALAAQDQKEYVKAQQVFSQYLHAFPDDPTTPDILLRQGLLYRQMGVTTLAISKFYAVMSTALKLKLDNIDYYKKLVLQAQMEIADTYYVEGKYLESADFFSRLSKMDVPDLDQKQIQFKLIRSLSYLTNYNETIARAQVFLAVHTNTSELPEVRFILASALKQIGRNQDAARQVLLLLQSQEKVAKQDPVTWIYWQQRAGNEIANQFYKDGDYLDALQIYLSLSDLDKSASWQLPVWYQIGLVYEQLQQWQKATDTYQRIIDRRNELTQTSASPSLLALLDMAGWRKDYIAWLETARAANQTFQRSAMSQASTSPSSPAAQ